MTAGDGPASAWDRLRRVRSGCEAGQLPRPNAASDRDNDLATAVALAEVAHRFRQLVKRVRPVDERSDSPGLDVPKDDGQVLPAVARVQGPEPMAHEPRQDRCLQHSVDAAQPAAALRTDEDERAIVVQDVDPHQVYSVDPTSGVYELLDWTYNIPDWQRLALP